MEKMRIDLKSVFVLFFEQLADFPTHLINETNGVINHVANHRGTTDRQKVTRRWLITTLGAVLHGQPV